MKKFTSEFSKFHPIVSFTYFFAVFGFSCIFIHPVTLLISLLSGFIYSVILSGRKAIKFNFLYMLPLILVTAVINPLFNHEGATILCYLPSGNPLTLESAAYGIASALMLWSVICHFSCFNKIITSDKLMYLSGKISPSLSLILSMILRFVPKFKVRLKTIIATQSCIGKDISKGNIISRAKSGIKVLSVMITWSFENAIDTADSMTSKGYGLANRSSYSNFRMRKRDIQALLYLIFLSVYIIAGGTKNMLYFKYFPVIRAGAITAYSVSVFIAYLLIFLCPIIIEVWEVIKWKKLKLKI